MTHDRLKRELGLPGACWTGMGSILGTGVFVSLALGLERAGSWTPLVLALAALLALCNGLSSAQLAGAFPVSGGTYEYATRTLHPAAGFAAGWLFLMAKSASAATAALGVGAYLAEWAGIEAAAVPRLVAVASVVLAGVLLAGGVRRTGRLNSILVGLGLAALAGFVLAAWLAAPAAEPSPAAPGTSPPLSDIALATALMFVAYTGYGRIATLGEEVRDPGRTIPRAVMLTLGGIFLVYVSVALAALHVLGGGAPPRPEDGSFLEAMAGPWDVPGLSALLALGAPAAMAGVLLNLLLGLSRVLLAMARRGDAPAVLTRLDRSRRTPLPALALVTAAVAGLAVFGGIRTAWTFSAFTVLLYYALTNAAALRLPPEHRRFPRAIAGLGLLGCFGLAFVVPPGIWAAGLVLLGAGFAVRALFRTNGPPGPAAQPVPREPGGDSPN